MRKSNAERQKEYRKRALHDPDGLLLTRLQVMLSAPAAAALERLCDQADGIKKREIVEKAILAWAEKMGAEYETE